MHLFFCGFSATPSRYKDIFFCTTGKNYDIVKSINKKEEFHENRY